MIFLSLTKPDIIRDIHLGYLRSGADIIETNTFSSTTIAQADYGMEKFAFEMNVKSAQLAREACAIVEAEQGRRCFVAGALGPTNRTASLSPDVNRPGFRATSFDDPLRHLSRRCARADRGRQRSSHDRNHF